MTNAKTEKLLKYMRDGLGYANDEEVFSDLAALGSNELKELMEKSIEQGTDYALVDLLGVMQEKGSKEQIDSFSKLFNTTAKEKVTIVSPKCLLYSFSGQKNELLEGVNQVYSEKIERENDPAKAVLAKVQKNDMKDIEADLKACSINEFRPIINYLFRTEKSKELENFVEHCGDMKPAMITMVIEEASRMENKEGKTLDTEAKKLVDKLQSGQKSYLTQAKEALSTLAGHILPSSSSSSTPPKKPSEKGQER